MFSIKCDISKFQRVMGQYIALSKKLPAEIANKNAKDVGIQAIKLTQVASREKIESDLNEPSAIAPWTTVAVILASKDGSKDPDKLIRVRKGHSGVCRLGWKPGVDVLTRAGAKGGFVPRLRNADGLGDAKPAVVANNHEATARIWNNYGEGNPEVTAVQTRGLNAAEQAVIADREKYVKRKLEEIASGTFGH